MWLVVFGLFNWSIMCWWCSSAPPAGRGSVLQQSVHSSIQHPASTAASGASAAHGASRAEDRHTPGECLWRSELVCCESVRRLLCLLTLGVLISCFHVDSAQTEAITSSGLLANQRSPPAASHSDLFIIRLSSFIWSLYWNDRASVFLLNPS